MMRLHLRNAKPDRAVAAASRPVLSSLRMKTLIVAAALLVIASLTSGEISPSATERLDAIEKRAGGRLGVAALDTGSGKRVEHRGDERFAMCSTFKVLAAAAILKRADAGELTLEDRVSYGAADLLEYAPVTREHVKEGAMSIGELCAAALEYSDNTAANLLLQKIGGPAGLTQFVRAFGDETTRLDRIEPQLNTALPADERDTTTPSAMLTTLRALLLGDTLSVRSRAQLEDWMVRNTTGAALIRAGVPADWRVGDKTGRGDHGVVNDIAIIRPPGRAPILLAIYFAESSAAVETRTAVIAEATRAALDALR